MSTIAGYIYKIEYNEDKEIRYIGSTTRSLKSRFKIHKLHYKEWLNNRMKGKCMIYLNFKKYGIKNFTMSLVKSYEVVDQKHLLAYEQLWMNKLSNINKNRAFSSTHDFKVKRREYRINNNIKINIYNKKYTNNNKNYFKEKSKEYYKVNKDKKKRKK